MSMYKTTQKRSTHEHSDHELKAKRSWVKRLSNSAAKILSSHDERNDERALSLYHVSSSELKRSAHERSE